MRKSLALRDLARRRSGWTGRPRLRRLTFYQRTQLPPCHRPRPSYGRSFNGGGKIPISEGRNMRRRHIVLFLAIAAASRTALAQQQSHSPQTAWVKQHRVVIQVDQDDPKAMNLALNNAA